MFLYIIGFIMLGIIIDTFYLDGPTIPSQTLHDIIAKEIRGTPNHVVLNRRYSELETNLRIMFSERMLSGPAYSRLKIFLRGEYEGRWEALTEDYKEGYNA